MGLNFCAGTPAMASMASSSFLWFNFTVNLPSCRSAGSTGCVASQIKQQPQGMMVYEATALVVSVYEYIKTRSQCVHVTQE